MPTVNGRISSGEMIICAAGAFASIVLLKYLLIRTERTSSCVKGSGDSVEGLGRNNQHRTRENDAAELKKPGENSATGLLPVIGLQNLGNTCYVNAILQALSCIPEFFDWMENSSQLVCLPQRAFSHPISSANEKPFFKRQTAKQQELKSRTFFHSLHKVMNVLNSHSHLDGSVYAATGLIGVMFSGMDRRLQHYQQDPDELFLFMVNLLSGGVANQYGFPFSVCKKNTKEDSKKFGVFSGGGPHPENLTSPLKEKAWLNMPFEGLFHQDLYCVVCKEYRPQPLEVFYSLSVSLPGYDQGFRKSHSLEELLNNYFTPADLDAVDCPRCAKASGANTGETRRVSTPHLKRISIAKRPKILCVHIRRAVWSAEQSWKRADRVSFPSALTLSKYSWLKHIDSGGRGHLKDSSSGGRGQGGEPQTSSKTGYGFFSNGTTRVTDGVSHRPVVVSSHQGIYCLKSVVVHLGQASSGGHIVTYRKGPVGGANSENWYFTSDQLVRSASWPEVEASNPYMLFYELKKPEKKPTFL